MPHGMGILQIAHMVLDPPVVRTSLQERVPESATNRDAGGPRFNATVIAICPGVLRSERLEMIPYWIELNPADLIQGTVVMSLAVYFFIFTLTSSVRRA